jgi:putative tryptophan/tyrosine transport system substrate-binding protein
MISNREFRISDRKTMGQVQIVCLSVSLKSVFRNLKSAIFLCAILLALCLPVEAQQQTKIPRIGFVLASGPEAPAVPPLRQGLRELGYVERKNILVEYRYAHGIEDRLPGLVSELVQLKVDVLIIPALRAIRAAQQATKTIPIVMVTTADPVAAGLVDSLARPGGNITGLTRLTAELSGKRLELLKEVVPGMSRVGVLWDADGAGSANSFKEYDAAARVLKMPLQSLEVRGPNPNLDGAFQAAAKVRVSGLIIVTGGLVNRYAQRIADLAIKNRLPSMNERSEYVEAGGLMSYTANDAESFRRAAYYVDKILKGTKPTDLPVEQPTKFDFVINLKTAKQIGLTISQWTLTKADRVIR